MIDYLIVGSGFGISFAELHWVMVSLFWFWRILKIPQNCWGLYNPVILKRFSEVWKAQEQLFNEWVLYF
jgi:hypothetical protein